MSGPTLLEVALYRVLANEAKDFPDLWHDELTRGLDLALGRLVARGWVVREPGGARVVREMEVKDG